MTAAPRGMVTVYSFSSGRSARELVPPTDVTTTPSGRPISSSWSTAPLVVWNRPPAASTTECRRFLLLVSVIRSPATNGPIRAPDGTAGSGARLAPSPATADPPQAPPPAPPPGGRPHVRARP